MTTPRLPAKFTLNLPDADALATLNAFKALAARRGRSAASLMRLLMSKAVDDANRRAAAKTGTP